MRTFGMHYVAGLALVAAAGSAQALGFNIALGNGSAMNVTTSNFGSSNGSYRGGEFTITTNAMDGAWPSAVPGSFVSYCVQLSETFSPGNLTGYAITSTANPLNQPPFSATQLDQIGRLMTYAYGTSGFNASNLTTGQANAVQAAIWEILYQPVGSNWSNFDLATGDFHINGALSGEMTTVSSWVTGGNLTAMTSYQSYQVLSAGKSQDFLVPVPEPESYALALAGLGVVGFALRRRRASQEAA